MCTKKRKIAERAKWALKKEGVQHNRQELPAYRARPYSAPVSTNICSFVSYAFERHLFVVNCRSAKEVDQRLTAMLISKESICMEDCSCFVHAGFLIQTNYITLTVSV